MSEPLSAAERRDLLAEYFAGREKLYALWYPGGEMVSAGGEAAEEPAGGMPESPSELAALQQRLSELWDRCETGVPVLPLSRCPYTGAEVRHSIDTYGLDGLWWDYHAPVRPPESLPSTYFALAGAVKLGSTLEEFPFLCRPGPEVPYVVPRLLGQPEIRAVISTVEVGNHRAFPTFYFADPFPGYISRVNTWGTAQFWFNDEEGNWVWDAVEDEAADFDFDLEPWIRSGKLLWIAPGDEHLRLRAHARACPYLGLEGRRFPMHLTLGLVLGSDEPEIDPEAAWPQSRETAAGEGA